MLGRFCVVRLKHGMACAGLSAGSLACSYQ